MICSEKFKNKTEFKRHGVADLKVVGDINSDTFDLALNEENGCLELQQGDAVYIITDEVGVLREAQATFIHIDGGMCIELNVGTLYLKDANGTIYGINEEGKVVYPLSTEVSLINWVTSDTLNLHSQRRVQYTFNLPNGNPLLVQQYIHNLAYEVVFNVLTNYNSPLFSIKFADMYKIDFDKIDLKEYPRPVSPSLDDDEDYLDILAKREEEDAMEEHIAATYDLSDTDYDDDDDEDSF